MARANAKRADAPTITVRIEKGKLVPVSAYDLELLDQWREGAELNVEVSMVKVRPLERKYFAMLSHLIKMADTPWSNTDTAHEAIKLATGFVTPIQRKTGEWGKLARHIASFDDTELEEYFALFCGMVQRKFGIDPDTLKKEAANSEYQSSGAVSKTAADDGPGDGTIPPVVGEPSPETEPGEPEAGGGNVVPRQHPPPADGNLTDEDMFWLKQTARMLLAASGSEDILNNQRRLISQYWTPATISTQAKAIGSQIYRLCKAGNPSKIEIATIAGCRLEDLRPEAR